MLLLSQIVGILVPRSERKGAISILCLAGETLAGMGGGYGFFTPANYWFGQSVGVDITEHSLDGEKNYSYQTILSPPGKIRFMNWAILWSYFYQNPEELERIADRLAVFYQEKDPKTAPFSLGFYYRAQPGLKNTKRLVFVKEYH